MDLSKVGDGGPTTILGKISETDCGFLTMSQSLLRNIKWQNILKILNK